MICVFAKTSFFPHLFVCLNSSIQKYGIILENELPLMHTHRHAQNVMDAQQKRFVSTMYEISV
ncbi:hypothetical protein DAPPUDRAFT_308230 [Daphnia pulex]|uniref:Uncharacterized protein n=1 Tax=Daphnia pulex TaxID=6669 RepID=E9I615_DAPPU|nr:hypothetical protein DAPPUDRAFT_308230 [Daphnia pulex]|eukprot:EFX60565.1 hypothetical protein DAPPUDRAFT_308230 [Daphnia pulex]